MMRRHILLIIFILHVFSATAQGLLTFSPAEWNFGTIQESDGRVMHLFTGVNSSSKPIVILDVVTSCGCTVPEFSKQPILPGAKAEIRVTFDPANRPGTFAKDLTVYSSERVKIATITIRGNVAARTKSIDELYPIDAGAGLRLDATLCAFSYIYNNGKAIQSSIGYANTTDRTLTLSLKPEIKSGLLTESYPRKIAPGERGELNFSYLIPATKPHYGTLRDVLQVWVDGRSNKTTLLIHGIGIDDPAEISVGKAPRAEVAENIIKFGSVKHTATEKRLLLTIANTGAGPLTIRSVETGGRIDCTLQPGKIIPAGGSLKAEVTLDPKDQEYGVLADQITLITNDPARPMRRIRVTAIIED